MPELAGDEKVSLRARTRSRELLLALLLASVSLALLVLAFVHFREKSPSARPVRFSINPPEKVAFADLDDAGPAMISPDGSRRAFVGVDDSGKSQLWVRPLDDLAAQPLAGTANATYPFWSLDSRNLAFFADGTLKKVSAGGGPSQTVCNAPGRGGSWGNTPDGGAGVIVFAPGDAEGLSRVSAAGGEPIHATALDSSRKEVSHRQPEFLPDGRHFFYVAISNQTDNNGIFIGEILTGDIKAEPDPKSALRLMAGVAHVSYSPAPPSAATPPSPHGYLLFPRDNNLMAQAFDAQRMELPGQPFVLADHVMHGINRHTSDFSVSANGVLSWRARSGHRQLAWFDRTGRQVEGLDTWEQYFNPSLSPDGKRIAASRLDTMSPPTGNIWILDPLRGSPARFTSGTGAQLLPVWSPDGHRIVYSLARPPDYGETPHVDFSSTRFVGPIRDRAAVWSELPVALIELGLDHRHWLSVTGEWQHPKIPFRFAILLGEQDEASIVRPVHGNRPLGSFQQQFVDGAVDRGRYGSDGRTAPDLERGRHLAAMAGRWQGTVLQSARRQAHVRSSEGGLYPRGRRPRDARRPA